MSKFLPKILVLVALLWGVAQAQPTSANRVAFDIKAQPLPQALQTFATQSGLQLLFHVEGTAIPGDLKSPRILGALTPQAALEQLLANTGLRYQFVNARTVTITSGAASGTRSLQDNISEGVQVGDSAPPQDSAPLEEVVVTAQKREERLIDVPISIVALSAENLQQREIMSIDDLALAVPGMSIQSSGNQRRIQLRGISNFGGSNSALIGMYLDEADVTSQSEVLLDLSTYDLERVEVLRGPQGTLYGDGSAGGTIHFVTRNPNLNRFGVDADVAALFTQDGGPSQRVQAVLNVPLVDDVLGVRVTGVFDHDGGWIDQPAADRQDFNTQDKTDVRIKALWQPTSQASVSALVNIHRNDASSNSGEDINGNFTQVFDLTTTPRVNDRFDIYNVTGSYEFSEARLLSSTSYVKQDKVTANYGYALPISPPPAAAFQVDLIPFDNDARILSQELRLASGGTGPWQWTVGGFYRRFQFEQTQTYLFGLPGPAPTVSYSSASSNLSKSWAAFGDTSYRLLDRLTLGAGLRYFDDSEKYFNGALQTATFHSLNPRLYVQYKVNNSMNVYASAAKGFRSGGFNNTPDEPSYAPESVWTEEIGTKASALEGHLNGDLALFYSDYTGYQITGVSPLGPPGLAITSNGGDARIKGFEWDLSWQPFAHWTLSANGDYVKSYFYKIGVTSPDHSLGDPLDFVPKYTLTFSAQRDFRVSGRPGFARLDFNEQGRETFRLRNAAGPTPWFFSESNVIHMLNFNSRLQWSDSLALGVFAQNLLNDRGLVDPLAIESDAARSRPRTYGVQLTVTFE